MASSNPTSIKQYEFIRLSAFRVRHLAIQQNGNTILLADFKASLISKPKTTLSLSDKSIVATCKRKSLSSDFLLFLGGNPDAANKSAWTDLSCEGFTRGKYHFAFQDRQFCWTRTHNKGLGASSWGGKDFKLVDESDPEARVLAIYVDDRKLLSINPMAKIDYFVELGRDLELLSLVTILGIQDSIRRRQRSTSAATTGGAGGAGA